MPILTNFSRQSCKIDNTTGESPVTPPSLCEKASSPLQRCQGVKNTPVDIEGFIKQEVNIKTMCQITQQLKKIGTGGYGSAYRHGDYVIKVPNDEISFDTDLWSSPLRTARYLNEFNGENHARAALTLDKKEVLVSTFINGEDVDDQEYVEQLLNEKGFMIYDPEQPGNMKKDSEGKYWLIDADLVVHNPESRRLSAATFYLESAMLISSKNDIQEITREINQLKMTLPVGKENETLKELKEEKKIAEDLSARLAATQRSRSKTITENFNYSLLSAQNSEQNSAT